MKNEKKLFSASDIVFAAVIIAAAAAFIIAFSIKPAGGTAIVSHGGNVIARLPLDSGTVFDAGGEFGNIIRVENGEVYMESASCPGRQCVHAGKIHKAGQSIVCVPAKLIITVVEGGGADVDAVTG